MRAFVTTLPKSGTHFVNILLQHLGLKRGFANTDQERAWLGTPSAEDRHAAAASALVEVAASMDEGQFLLHHFPYHPLLADGLAAAGIAVIALIRDPRDFVVSFAHHTQSHPTAVTKRLVDAAVDLHDLQRLICERRYAASGLSVASVVDNYLSLCDGWVTDPRALTLHFEDIVGPRGGESIRDQLACGLGLTSHLGLGRDIGLISRAFARSYDPEVAMFRKGKARSWIRELAPPTAATLWNDQETLMERWGYAREGGLRRPARTGVDDMDAIVEEGFAALSTEVVALQAHSHRLKQELRKSVAAAAAAGAGKG